MAKNDLTEYASEGYAGNQNLHLQTSPAWYAHELGTHLHKTGRCKPRDVRMGRGDSIRANDMRFKFRLTNAKRIEFERVE